MISENISAKGDVTEKSCLCAKWFHSSQLFVTHSQLLTTLKKKSFENIVEKGENSGNQHFPPFPTVFSALPTTI